MVRTGSRVQVSKAAPFFICYNKTMNKLLKRGFDVYKIFLKNKLAVSLMMFVSGVIMTIAALNGRGNDTKTLPTLITAAGVLFSLWAFYRFGYVKANYDNLESKAQRDAKKRVLIFQFIEALVYLVITAAGIYLLMNESLVNLILNLMVGGFTTFNGIMGVINLIKRRAKRDWRWIIRLILTIFELAVGIYFIVLSSAIDIRELLVMGILTAVAGIIEIISAYSTEALKNTVEDGKAAVRVIKTGKATEEKDSGH